MSFSDDLKKFSMQIQERKQHILNEETTKHSIIIPFLQLLGYDVFNPLEVKPEYIADFGKKKGEKVDYAIFKNGQPIIFIEVKSINEKLENHDSQLSRYFNATPEVKVAILTNGIKYKFFTDLNTNNIMDTTPFFEFDLENISETDIEVLTNFRKDFFEVNNVIKYAEELVYMSNLEKNIKELFKNPSDDFIRFLIKDFTDTRITTAVIDKFRPIVKKAISLALLDIISQGIFQTNEIQNHENNNENERSEITEQLEEESKKQIITTEEELKSFEIVKDILNKAGYDTSLVNYKDTTNYFGIHYKNTNNWFLRISLLASIKYVLTRLEIENLKKITPSEFIVEPAPKGIGVSRIIINSYEDLLKLKDVIVACYENILKQ